jgi:hypothetical protein
MLQSSQYYFTFNTVNTRTATGGGISQFIRLLRGLPCHVTSVSEKLSNKEIENAEQGQNSEYTCKICRNYKAKTSMLAIELPKRNVSSNIDILGEGKLRNDEVQDANGTNICHVCTAIIETTFEIRLVQ